jgi:site-specific DNA-adenine methylase
MAYPGSKKDRIEELRSFNLPSVQFVVDPFFGSGGLTCAFDQLQHETLRFRIAGEAFEPLRSLYSSKIDLDELAKKVMKHVRKEGPVVFWEIVRDCLAHKGNEYSSSEAFIILNNLSHGNSLRHGRDRYTGELRHNIKFSYGDKSKFEALKKRGCFIDPIAIKPTSIYGDWRSALMAAGGDDSIALLDPPYLKSAAIYPHEHPTDCAIPPIELAMSRRYAAIVAYNSPDKEMGTWLTQSAKNYGYSIEGRTTDWKTKFSATSKDKEAKEFVWVFKLQDKWRKRSD